MWTIEWKTYEQMTDYEKLKFDLNKKIYGSSAFHTKRTKGITYYYLMYKDNKLWSF